MPDNSSDAKRSKGGGRFLIVILGLVASVYILQFLLDFIFRAIETQDDVTEALQPFQNHYLSFSPYFITTEGGGGEFTSDITAAGRFFGGSIVAFILFVVIVVILYLIKPLRKYFDVISRIGFIGLILIVFYSAFFLPPRKAVFNPSKKELTLTINTSLINSKSATVKYEGIEKFEYDFHTYRDGYSMQTNAYCQLFAVVNGKRVMIGENEVEFSGEDKDWHPSEEQKAMAEKGLSALNKLLSHTSN